MNILLTSKSLRLVSLLALIIGFAGIFSSPAKAESYSISCGPGARGIKVHKNTPTFSSVGRPTGNKTEYSHTIIQSHAWYAVGPSTSPDFWGNGIGNCNRLQVRGRFTCVGPASKYAIQTYSPVDILTGEYVYPEGRFSRQPLRDRRSLPSRAKRELPNIFWPEGGVTRLDEEDCLYWITNGVQ